jgi:hypothetical protein
MADHPSRVAVVTGAGSGIGAAVAHALAGQGWVVVLAGRRREALASVAERGAELSGVLDPVPADVTDEASVRALFDPGWRAVLDVFDKPVIARCQLHKVRNVRDRLPDKLRAVVEKRMRQAYHASSVVEAESLLTALAKELGKTHPGAGASLREGPDETPTVLRLDVPPTPARTLRSTNSIESMISICRDHSRNVKNWRDGHMALRWCAAGMIEAGKQFRRVNGHLHLRQLRDTLDVQFTEPVSATCDAEHEQVA